MNTDTGLPPNALRCHVGIWDKCPLFRFFYSLLFQVILSFGKIGPLIRVVVKMVLDFLIKIIFLPELLN